jgi:hypothetical protein
MPTFAAEMTEMTYERIWNIPFRLPEQSLIIDLKELIARRSSRSMQSPVDLTSQRCTITVTGISNLMGTLILTREKVSAGKSEPHPNGVGIR